MTIHCHPERAQRAKDLRPYPSRGRKGRGSFVAKFTLGVAEGLLRMTVRGGCVLALLGETAAAQTIEVRNPISVARPHETVELRWAEVQRALPGATPASVRVVDSATGQPLVTQTVDADADDQPDLLLFQTHLWPEETRVFSLQRGDPPAAPVSRAYAAHIPERDDVAWENDRIGFRTYGEGLWRLEDLHSSGIDVWTKRTRDLVIDKWYREGHYHTDTGEGADFYKVGPTLGAGGTAIWNEGELLRSENFSGYRILETGPIRTLLELTYDPWAIPGGTASETKRITLDAGHHLFRQESTFHTASGAPLTYAIGTVKRSGLVGSTRRGPRWSWLSTWGPVDPAGGGHGELGTAVLLPSDALVEAREIDDHYIALATARSGSPTIQYVGAGWTASGDFDSVEDWWRYLDHYAERLANPIRVRIRH